VTSYITGLGGTPGPGYFTDNNGQPKLWVAAETWGLPGKAGEWSASGGGTWQQDFDNFFSQRAAQGVTVLMADPVTTSSGAGGGGTLTGGTWDGLTPFTSGGDPGTGLDATFWARMDYMLNSALANGITFAFTLNNYNFQSGATFAAWTTTQFTSYGAALGARYASQPNIIWLFGNDEFQTTHDSFYSATMTALAAAGDTHLTGLWWSAEYTSRYECDNNAVCSLGVSNSAFNFGYTYNAGYLTAEYAYGEVINRGQAHLLPYIQGDGYFYQGTAGATYDASLDRASRQEAWWNLASGARGFCSESENTWQWDSGACPAAVGTNWFWVNNLPHIVSAFSALSGWQNLIPDLSSALVTAGRGTRVTGFASGGSGGLYEPAFTNSWVAASVTPDKTLAVLYLPNHTTITIDQTKLAAGYGAKWMDPVTGVTTTATAGSTYNSTAQGTNSAGDPDWVLILASPPYATWTVP
jgi:hypothetical protein